MQAQIAFFAAKIGTKDCFLAKNGGLEALMAHSWAGLPGLTSQALTRARLDSTREAGIWCMGGHRSGLDGYKQGPTMLTDTQKHQFETLGFLRLRQLIPPDQMATYVDAFDETMLKGNGGVPYVEAPKRQDVVPFYRNNPAVYHRLLDHDGIYEVVEDLVGEDFIFSVSEGCQHYGGTRWHHDSVSPEDQTHLKVVLYLDPVRADSGCLSVLPGSQFAAFRKRIDRYGDDILSLGKGVPGTYPIESDPGDAVVFNIKLHHAAFGDNPRRGIYLNFIQKPRSSDEEDYIVNLYQSDASHGWVYYTRELFEDASPKRMRMLAFLKQRCYDGA